MTTQIYIRLVFKEPNGNQPFRTVMIVPSNAMVSTMASFCGALKGFCVNPTCWLAGAHGMTLTHHPTGGFF